MKIIFKHLEFKNFRSVGNIPIKIDMNTHRTTLISGENGHGKSTVLYALCFVLFGRGYGQVTKPSLINSINQKDLLVNVEFSIGKKEYKINRGMKPNIFEILCDGKLVNQDPSIKDYQKYLEQQILKFNYRAFSQVIVVGGGTDYTPFMKLPAKDRREFVEDLLDIRVFSTMGNMIKEHYKDSKDQLKELAVLMKSQKEKIVLQESFIKKLRKEKEDSADKILNNIKALAVLNADLEATLSSTMDSLEFHKKTVDILDIKTTEISSIRLKGKSIQSDIDKKNSYTEKYKEMIVCPTCHQDVGDKHKQLIIDGVNSDIDALEKDMFDVVVAEAALKIQMEKYSGALDAFNKTQKIVSSLSQDIFSNNVSIKNMNSQIVEIQSDTISVDDEQLKLKTFAKEFLSLDTKKKEILVIQQYQECMQQILSDSGIKSKIIKQYIPTINKLINKYLADLDFFCSFFLDEEFNESIKSRHRDSFTYDNFSDGQKRRIDLAILLAWMDIAKAKNALHCNVVFFDEIDAPLDSTGSELLHATLRSCSADHIFIISHKGDLLADKADNTIKFKLHNNFTQIAD